MSQQKITIEIPDGYDPADLDAIGSDIAAFIRDRSRQGYGVRQHGNHFRNYDFPGYSREYAKRKGSTKVDLTLDDNMLNAIEVLAVKKRASKIDIGFSGGKENDKAEGNQLGSYGRDPNPRKARRFLGVTTAELELILAAYDKAQQ